jgi:O-antigen ligase
LGTGGRGFHILSPRYIPNIVDEHGGEERSVHNTYLQLTAEWGIQGLIVWSAFIVSTFRLLRRSRLAAKGDDWFFYRFLAVELALLGTLVAGIFTNRLYGESVYWMCALGFALHRMHLTATATQSESAAAPLPATMVPVPVSAGSAR